jgi:hypothetical protein
MDKKTIVAIFDDRAQARAAVQALHHDGFEREQISLMTRTTREETGSHSSGTTREPVAKDRPLARASSDEHAGVKTGAATGGFLGGLGGLLLGLGSAAVPGVGPAAIAGPLASTLIGAGVGAVAGGLVGALVDLGVPERDAHIFSEAVRRGSVLVAVTVPASNVQRVTRTLGNFEPVDIERRAEDWRKQGWTRFEESNPPLQSQPGHDRLGDWREHFTANVDSHNDQFEEFAPAYRFGWTAAADDKFHDRPWHEVRDDLKAEWIERHGGDDWVRMEPAIQHGFRSNTYVNT